MLNVTNPDPDFFREQAAMMNVKDANPGYEKHFKWVSPRLFNAYAVDNHCIEKDMPTTKYEPGDFVLHFPAHSGVSWFPDYLRKWDANVKGLEEITIP